MIRAQATLIAIDTDLIFPAHKMKDMAKYIKGSEYHEITSHFGHDGFLLETDQLDRIIRPIVEKLYRRHYACIEIRRLVIGVREKHAQGGGHHRQSY